MDVISVSHKTNINNNGWQAHYMCLSAPSVVDKRYANYKDRVSLISRALQMVSNVSLFSLILDEVTLANVYERMGSSVNFPPV